MTEGNKGEILLTCDLRLLTFDLRLLTLFASLMKLLPLGIAKQVCLCSHLIATFDFIDENKICMCA